VSSRRLFLICVVILSATAAVELSLGRLVLGPDGRFGWIETSVWRPHQSQRVVDWYSVSHVLHGILFYPLFRFLWPRRSMGVRFVGAVLLEAGWEVLENSPIIINRYREVTMALGYVGDSVLNSVSDVVMMMLGFLVALRVPVWTSVAIVVGLELVMLAAIRDNLTLNILMLLAPVDAIRDWQMEAAPPGLLP